MNAALIACVESYCINRSDPIYLNMQHQIAKLPLTDHMLNESNTVIMGDSPAISMHFILKTQYNSIFFYSVTSLPRTPLLSMDNGRVCLKVLPNNGVTIRMIV